MTKMNLVDPASAPKAKPEHHDWKTAAPRWLLLAAIGLLIAATGFFYGKYQTAADKRLEAAFSDTPNRYQARLAERVAGLEATQLRFGKQMDELAEQVKAQNTVALNQTIAMAELTAQMRMLTEEIKRLRR